LMETAEDTFTDSDSPSGLTARVHGEPYTELPQDLYIPPDALEVFLETFEGPLDLLLYLIRRHNLNILDIPIADITRQYMEYLGLMQQLQLELAAEYLVMAAVLAEIKSRMLLPRISSDDETEDDPRAELVRRLQEYERFKRAAEDLDALPRLERDVFTVSVELTQQETQKPPPPVALGELFYAIKEVMARAELYDHHHVQREPLSVRERMSQILERLSEHEAQQFVAFVSLFDAAEGRMGVVVTLLATLELIRESLIELVQSEAFAPIYVRLRT
jgi:segregation and condensation protein A